MHLLDLHSHLTTQEAGVIRIQSLHLSEATFLALPKKKLMSIGMHPWYTKYENFPKLLKYLKVIAMQENVMLIGECGLDKLKGEPLDKQIEVLVAQIKLADELAKPVILHCVRAFDELIQIKKQLKVSVSLIVHGFQKNPELAKQLIQHGFYLSFGSAIMKNESLQQFLASYQGVFFLETDEGEFDLLDIYKKVADLKKISVENLKDIIFANWEQIGLHPVYKNK